MSLDIIKLLPDSVANQIAAGEVIQRPASVIKELVENAVDAGATDIKIIIKDAGRTLLQVVDNGCGMSATDARMAFERHSTSKIQKADDLYTLHTMGFRGEALASIAAVAQVDLRTMRPSDSVGTRLIINGSHVESQQPEACTPGTNMMVKNLFFNIPARRKFLKKDSVELANIVHEFERLALVNTDVAFTLIHNDVTVHQLLRGTLKQRICELFGASLERQLLPISTETSIAKISGYVVRPENARRRGAQQFFFVNGRNMRHPFFHKGVMQCYENLIAPDMQPSYFIKFEVDPASIDVNIHPQKHEIKFENELPVRQILVAAIRESLGKFNVGPAIDFNNADAPAIPPFNPDVSAIAGLTPHTDFNPFAIDPTQLPQTEMTGAPAPRSDTPGASNYQPRFTPTQRPSSLNNWEKLYESFANRQDTVPSAAPTDNHAPTLPESDNSTDSVTTLQVLGRYIVSPCRSGMMIIDQHRAHVRVLFEQFMREVADGAVACQRLMFPEVLALDPTQNLMMQEIVNDLPALGFDIAYLGDSSWSVNGLPAEVASLDARALFTSLLADMMDEHDGSEELRSRLARTTALRMAREKAVKHGQTLTPDEQQRLLADLLRLSEPALTPSGLTTMRIISRDDLTRLFESGLLQASGDE